MRIPALFLGVLAACGSSTPPPAPPTPAAPAPAPDAPAWQNPGGMWLPQQIPTQGHVLRTLGLEIDPAALADPTAFPLGAVVSLGGCSASFVSPDGLIATNHHCVQRVLAYLATPEANVIEKGYLARTRADEKWAGPTSIATVATKITDVTPEMTQGLAAIGDDAARHDEIEEREKRLVAACEKDRPELRCDVKSFFGGGRWYLYEQLEIRDLRLVYAPARGIGNYGGDVDNWMWPRHTGDFSFLRAYVGKDGKPAEHAEDNIPYKPAHHLRLAREPLREGDLVLVAGFPGTTKRLVTAAEVEDAATWSFPRGLALMEQHLAVLREVTSGKPELRIKAEPTRRGLANYLKKNGGVLETLTKGGVLAERKEQAAKLAAWVDADPARAGRFKPALTRLEQILAEQRRTRETDAAWKELLGGSKLLEQAVTIVRLAGERVKPDPERKLEYQQRNWKRFVRSTKGLRRSYAREIDRAQLEMFVQRALALPADQRPPGLEKIVGKKLDEKSVDAALDRLYKGTKLEDLDTRLQLLETATPQSLARSKDSFIRLAMALLPEIQAAERRRDAHAGAMAVVAPIYVAALTEMRGKEFAPDANGSLRVTYGTVMPPASGGKAFTLLSEVVAKHTGEEPFDAPAALLDAARSGAKGPYVASELGDVPVDFMTDADITNGNSGSATLNGRGELVGLAFDGTLDTVASDWLYMEKKSRSIHVDARYMLWVMDAVDGADHLVEELGATPAVSK